jgi:hypothetical protein
MTVGISALLLLAVLGTASFAISRSAARIKTVVWILVGLILGFLGGTGLGVALGSSEAAGHLAFLLMFCGALAVSIHKIRHPGGKNG